MRTSNSLHVNSAVMLAIAISCTTLTQAVAAQFIEQPSLQNTSIIFNDPKPPRQGSPTGRQRGGASRGPCRQFEALTAMVPVTNGMVWGQTLRDRPSFWFYVPQTLTSQTPVEFTLQGDGDTDIYSNRFTVANLKPGLIQVQIPDTAKALEQGKSYTWTFSVYCDPAKPSSAVFVKGSVKRASSDPQKRPKLVGPIEQARFHAVNGIWYDAFDILATLYRDKPSDHQLKSDWTTLLQQANLSNFSTTSFSPCCTASPGF